MFRYAWGLEIAACPRQSSRIQGGRTPSNAMTAWVSSWKQHHIYNQSVIPRNELCKSLEKFIGEEVTFRQIVKRYLSAHPSAPKNHFQEAVVIESDQAE